MTGFEDGARVRRLKWWIAGLTLLPAAALLAAGFPRAASGYAVGGSLILLNLLGTERAVLSFLGSGGGSRLLTLAFYLGKLALTALIIAGVLVMAALPPLALLLGISTLLLALMFDFLFFPRNIGNREEL